MKILKKKVLPEFPGITWVVDDLVPEDKIFAYSPELIDEYLKKVEKRQNENKRS